MINTYSNPTDLKITDMRFVDIDGAPKRCTILKIMTNQGITGYGEVRDASSKTYALMLKSRILGENPCNVDRIFRKIKQFGGPSRQGGGVSGIEIALWDLAGKAYGVPMVSRFTSCSVVNTETRFVCTAIPTLTASIQVTTWGLP